MPVTSTETPPQAPSADPPERRGLAARVRLGAVFAPVSSEFLLIASTALLLTGFGLVMILSATSATATAAGQQPYDAVLKQAVFAVIGIPLMFIASRLPLSFWKKAAWPGLIAASALQLLVLTPLGVENDGNRNWISIGGLQAQPAEFLKLALALWLGTVLFRKQALLGKWRHALIPALPVTILVIGTDLAGGDLGTAMILFVVALAGLFFSGVKLRILLVPLTLSAAAVGFLALNSSNRMARIMSFLNPDTTACYYNECYQSLHGIWGLAGGGILGLGLGNSKEKYDWLPAAANDYIFAIIGEELGLVGCLVVLALFTIFAIGAFHIVRRSNDMFVRVVAGAIGVWVIGQALLNIGVVLRLFPVLGVPLPFVSQGGTSLISVLLASGVLLSFARNLPPKPAARRTAAPDDADPIA
ncbi:putative lipid II flippase FtsW [Microbacterium sp. X-17]|uniref:putative lipid II flippase FtsW n=1 Tax=Microbacterium sp. X-17 TaxID=3144404 RepID=UPI0031F59ACE